MHVNERTATEKVAIRSLHKSYGAQRVLRGVSLAVRPGEFVSLLGPSGCGKTTLLNTIAGFLTPDSGDVLIDGRSMRNVPPYRRNLGMVFQNYSLFPHMTVFDNVAFGLRMKGQPRREITERTTRALNLVHLNGMEDRYPRALSGGQQQRVGLARALIVEPSVMLLDEPLSNLDAKLRKLMQVELRQIHDLVGITTIYVTHDQEEALTLSDRVALLRDGQVEQLGTPAEIYQRPHTEFAASFIGEASFLSGVVTQDGLVDIGGLLVRVGTMPFDAGQAVRLGVRPDKVNLSAKGNDDSVPAGTLKATVTSVAFAGSHWRVVVEIPFSGTVLAHVPTDDALNISKEDQVLLRVDEGNWIIVPEAE